MRRTEALVAVVLVLVIAWVIATAVPAWAEVTWDAVVLLLFAGALAAATGRARGLRATAPSPFNSLLRDSDHAAPRPSDLERIERLVSWQSYSQHDFDHRLRPMIVQLIRHRLHISRGVELDDPRLFERLSPELSALIAPQRSEDDRLGSVTTEDLIRALDEIEAL
jgi:hypothetical protein